MSKHLISTVALLFIGIALFTFAVNHSMRQGFEGDEHQFIASAVLLAKHHLFPYRDYPYFHAPNLVFVYAILFEFTKRLLLAARLFSAVCAALTMFVIFLTALTAWKGPRRFTSWLVAASAALLLAGQPLFLYTSGRVWNHDLPELLLLLAVLAHCKWMRAGKGPTLFLSAVLVGLAAGTRLSYVPPIMAFVGAIVFMTRATRRWKSLSVFAAGMAASLIPSTVTFALAPSAFLFGNMGYHVLTIAYHRELGSHEVMTLTGKLAFLGSLLVEDYGALLLLILLFLAVLLLGLRHGTCLQLELVFITTVILCCFLAAFIPTPSWPQYFYQPIPFLVVGIVLGVASLHADARPAGHTWADLLLAVAVISVTRWSKLAVFTGFAVAGYFHPEGVVRRSEPVPESVHRLGLETRARVGSGKVLTLTPVFPLEGGLDIYPELATGDFGFRTAPFLDAVDRRRFRMVSYADLDEFLRRDPPGGILVGASDPRLEDLLIQYAKRHGYMPLPVSDQLTAWVPRAHSP